MPIRAAKAWHVYRYQNSSSEHDGKYVLALLVDASEIHGVFINSEYARNEQLKKIEVRLCLDFLPRPKASIRFDMLISGSFEGLDVRAKEKNWIVEGQERYQVLTKALSSESRLVGKVKKRLRLENSAFLNERTQQELRSS